MASGQPGGVAMDPIECGMTTPPEYRVSDAPDLDCNTASARQRSSSPWAFTLSTKAVNRVRSNEGSGVSTPIGRYGRVLNAGAAAATRQAAARASYESALLAAVRKQMDAFEEKVGNQISRFQSQSDRLREATLSRLEEKMSVAEGFQPKLDRRIAELSGHFKGLSEEMQSQIRRVDMMDERLWEWRHQMEEDFQRKYTEFDNHVQKVSSSSRMMHSTLEDAHKKHLQRVHRLECDIAERMGAHEDTREGLLHLHSRLEAVESRRGFSEEFVPIERASSRQELRNLNEEVEFTMLEKHIADMSEKVERLFQDSIDMHTASKAQEVELKTLRTLFDTREEHHRMLSERVERADYDGKLEQVRQVVHSDSRQQAELLEKLEVFTTRLNLQDQAFEELRSRHEQLLRNHRDLSPVQAERHLDSFGIDAYVTDQLESRGAADVVNTTTMEDYLGRLAEVEHRLAALDPDVNLWPQVGVLVTHLQEIKPKVIQHEQNLSDLNVMRDVLTQLQAEVQEHWPNVQRHTVTRDELLSTTERHVSKEELASTTELLKTSLQLQVEETCRDSDRAIRREFEQAIHKLKAPNSSGEASPRTPRSDSPRSHPWADILERIRPGLPATSRQDGAEFRACQESVQVIRKELSREFDETTGQLRRDHQHLHDKIAGIEKALASAGDATATRCHNGNDGAGASARLAEEVASLRAAFDVLTTSEDSGSSPLDELLHIVQQDEQLEQETHRRLLGRIDELCERIAEVDRQVERHGCARAAEAGSTANGVPAELSTKLEKLADRVDAQSQRCIELHTKLQGKFTQMTEVVEKHVSRTGE